ncbi:DUF4189 domain-containing protein [Nocardia sp. NPDC058666]|uniref:DUF4189 domain-containing protein n=1 Tax=Nocardia sp. NPDC058666 TaxID=3346587 RepID=UPI003652625A
MSFMGKAGFAVAAMGLAAGSVLGAGSASAAGNQWASIAVSHAELIYGTSANEGDVASAEAIALADCHYASCEVLVSWANGCAALVQSKDAFAWAVGANRAEAERVAYEQLSTRTPTAILANTGSANLSGAKIIDVICTANAR